MRASDQEQFQELQRAELLVAQASVACGSSSRNLLAEELELVWQEYADEIG